MFHASGTARVRYLPRIGYRIRIPRVRYSARQLPAREDGSGPARQLQSISITPSPPRRSRPLSLKGRRIRGERLRASGTPRVRYSARQLPAERGCRIAAPRVRYSARQLPAERGCRIAAPRVRYSARQVHDMRKLDSGSARQLLSIYPPPPLGALGHSPWRDRGIRGMPREDLA